MSSSPEVAMPRRTRAVKWLTYLMFMMFAMTTDSVGVIIPEVVREFHLTLTAAGALHYAPMLAIALAGALLGFLADRWGRKTTIVLGLALFALDSWLFAVGERFGFFLGLLTVSGVAIGIFKTGALALIGDISGSARDHTATMNTVEGFFGVGAIIGPAIVVRLLANGLAWKWLYVIAGALCGLLILLAIAVPYPRTLRAAQQPASLAGTLRMVRSPWALACSVGAFLYVAVECAVYVWMPTLLAHYTGRLGRAGAYALSIFFVLRAAGRFIGAWVLRRWDWAPVLTLASGGILGCFAGSLAGGSSWAVALLPLSGLMMAVVYPTLNSKGISCYEKSEHGAVAGLILFFTAAGAALGPLAMGAASDRFGAPVYGFVLASGFALLLFLGCACNWARRPASSRLERLEASQYSH